MTSSNEISSSQISPAEDLTITYTLFGEGEKSKHYSLLVSLKNGGKTEETLITDICAERSTAEGIFVFFVENQVLPCEIEALFSDGAFDGLI